MDTAAHPLGLAVVSAFRQNSNAKSSKRLFSQAPPWVERPDIPDILNRKFDVPAPSQIWCGDITYIWAQGKWHFLAVVLDLCARRIVGWALSHAPEHELPWKLLGTHRGNVCQEIEKLSGYRLRAK